MTSTAYQRFHLTKDSKDIPCPATFTFYCNFDYFSVPDTLLLHGWPHQSTIEFNDKDAKDIKTDP